MADGALRVGVDEQRLHAATRECGREVDRRRCLADAALLADDREDLAHGVTGRRLRRGQLRHRTRLHLHPSSPGCLRRAGSSARIPRP